MSGPEWWKLRSDTLSPGVVIDARRRARRGAHIPEMAAELQVNAGTLRQAVTGKSWASLNHIEPPVLLTANRMNRRLSEDDVREIRRRRDEGESISSLAAAYRMTPTNISSIIRRKTWRHVD